MADSGDGFDFDPARALYEMMGQMTTAFNRMATQPAQPGWTIERFKRLDPPSFSGGPDPAAAEEWIQDVTKILRANQCPQEDWVRLATYLLRGEAEFWWESMLGILVSNDEQIDWKGFEEAFYDHYFPQVVRDQKEEEFLALTQGDMSVLEYERKFTALARFAGPLVQDESQRVRRFQKGLRREIRATLAAVSFTSYKEVVRRALLVERELGGGAGGSSGTQTFGSRTVAGEASGSGAKGSQKSGGSKFHNFFRRFGKKKENTTPQQPSSVGSQHSSQHSSGSFSGQKRKSSDGSSTGSGGFSVSSPRYPVKCFYCQQTGHIMRNCQKKAFDDAQRGGQRAPVQARVYAVTRQDAETSNAVVEGKKPVDGQRVDKPNQ